MGSSSIQQVTLVWSMPPWLPYIGQCDIINVSVGGTGGWWVWLNAWVSHLNVRVRPTQRRAFAARTMHTLTHTHTHTLLPASCSNHNELIIDFLLQQIRDAWDMASCLSRGPDLSANADGTTVQDNDSVCQPGLLEQSCTPKKYILNTNI